MKKKNGISKYVMKIILGVLLAIVLYFLGYSIISSVEIARFGSYYEDNKESVDGDKFKLFSFYVAGFTYDTVSEIYQTVIEKEPYLSYHFLNDDGETANIEFYSAVIFSKKQNIPVSFFYFNDISAINKEGVLEKDPALDIIFIFEENIGDSETNKNTVNIKDSESYMGSKVVGFISNSSFIDNDGKIINKLISISINLTDSPSENAQFISIADSVNNLSSNRFPNVSNDDKIITKLLQDYNILDKIGEDFKPEEINASLYYYDYFDLSSYNQGLVIAYIAFIPTAIAIFYVLILHGEVKKVLAVRRSRKISLLQEAAFDNKDKE